MSTNFLESRIKGTINAKSVKIGKGVVVEEGAIITGKGGPAEEVILEDFAYVGESTKIITPQFKLGEYSKLHAHSFAHGSKPMQIGRCCWIGSYTVLDSLGGLDIDDNVGIGAHSQIWTHIQFGDIVEGSRFFQNKYMHIGKDAWLVGHCIVSPVKIEPRSMALVGSVVTKDMLANHIYAGSPAKDITEKAGTQFEDRTVEQKVEKMQSLVDQFYKEQPQYEGELVVVSSENDYVEGKTCFDMKNRLYTKTLSEAEVAFLQKNVPLVKFTPAGSEPLVVPQEVA